MAEYAHFLIKYISGIKNAAGDERISPFFIKRNMPERAKASSQPAARPFANILAAYVPRFWGLSVFCA